MFACCSQLLFSLVVTKNAVSIDGSFCKLGWLIFKQVGRLESEQPALKWAELLKLLIV